MEVEEVRALWNSVEEKLSASSDPESALSAFFVAAFSRLIRVRSDGHLGKADLAIIASTLASALERYAEQYRSNRAH
jgi:hypothetical protein